MLKEITIEQLNDLLSELTAVTEKTVEELETRKMKFILL